jgi:hypothetical protein
MNKTKLSFVLILLILPLAALTYKRYQLEIPLVPKKASNSWNIEFMIDETAQAVLKDKPFNDFVFPIPETSPNQLVEEVRVDGKSLNQINLYQADKDFISWSASTASPYRIISYQMTPLSLTEELRSPQVSLGPQEKEKYLDLGHFTENDILLLKKLEETLTFENDPVKTKIEKYFFYLADEIVLNPKSHKISDLINLSSGSYLAQAKTLMGLARLQKVPARIIFGVKFLDSEQEESIRYARTLLTEVYLNGRWLPYLPEERLNGELNSKNLILCRQCGEYADQLNNSRIYSLIVKPVKYDPLTSEEQLVHLTKISPFWAQFSLHRLPLSVQAILLGIILVPFGTIVISFARVILGVETFGIFMPILITLFFIETSFLFGFLFFSVVVLLGLLQRNFLDSFYILAVPRLSILLSFTIIIYLLFAIASVKLDILSISQKSLSYFPIVIITVFIEKLSLSFQEEGATNTLKTALGTVLVSVLCYLLLDFDWLKIFLFNNPEMILFSIGMNILIGSYTGFRLLEILRFRAIDENIKFK